MTGQRPCDVVVTRDRRVFINGVEVTNVMDFTLHMDQSTGTYIELTFHPSSIVQGEPPRSTVEAMHEALHPEETNVDIGKAIAQAKARAEGRT